MTDEQKLLIVRLGQLDKFKSLLPYYTKPAAGIPATDLTEAVQASLAKAETALQASVLETLNNKVAALESLIDESGDPTAAIDKFNEIVAFLANITNTQTLNGILAGINNAIAEKASKVASATDGNLAGLDANGNLKDSGVKPSDFKTKQTAVSDPTASGDAIEFIDTISQNANGEISVTKKAARAASAAQAGVMSAAHYQKVEAIAYATDADIEALFA